MHRVGHDGADRARLLASSSPVLGLGFTQSPLPIWGSSCQIGWLEWPWAFVLVRRLSRVTPKCVAHRSNLMDVMVCHTGRAWVRKSRHHAVNEILARSPAKHRYAHSSWASWIDERRWQKTQWYDACSLVRRKIIGLKLHLPLRIDWNYFSSGGAASAAEVRKCSKYADIRQAHIFILVAEETFGAWGQEAVELIEPIGRRMFVATQESTFFLRQRIYIAIQ